MEEKKMTLTRTMNLNTGIERFYLLDPKEAVVCAFNQSNHNYNTWDYDFNKAKVSKSGSSVSCGDWVALTK